jgi:hypothetical protein
MNWLTYSKGAKKELIESELKPLCVKLNIRNAQGHASINLLKEFIINDDENFPKNILGKNGMLKKTITYYLQNGKNVKKLITILEKIKQSIDSGITGKQLTTHGFLIAKGCRRTNTDDDDVDEDLNEKKEMYEIVGDDMDNDPSDYSDDEVEDLNEVMRR